VVFLCPLHIFPLAMALGVNFIAIGRQCHHAGSTSGVMPHTISDCSVAYLAPTYRRPWFVLHEAYTTIVKTNPDVANLISTNLQNVI
jgi:hypothetical protein